MQELQFITAAPFAMLTHHAEVLFYFGHRPLVEVVEIKSRETAVQELKDRHKTDLVAIRFFDVKHLTIAGIRFKSEEINTAEPLYFH